MSCCTQPLYSIRPFELICLAIYWRGCLSSTRSSKTAATSGRNSCSSAARPGEGNVGGGPAGEQLDVVVPASSRFIAGGRDPAPVQPEDDAGTDVPGSDDPPDVYVRPYGYVEPGPVVRRIGERDLFLGNARAADPGDHAEGFAHVLSATSEPRPLTTHHHPLVDGPGTGYREFADAVDAARRLHRREGALLVHCRAGVSRSTALVATAVAAEEGRPLRAALAEVQEARPYAIPHPALHELAVVYLAAEG